MRTEAKMSTFWDAAKAMFIKSITLIVSTGKEEQPQNNDLNFHCKTLEK